MRKKGRDEWGIGELTLPSPYLVLHPTFFSKMLIDKLELLSMLKEPLPSSISLRSRRERRRERSSRRESATSSRRRTRCVRISCLRFCYRRETSEMFSLSSQNFHLAFHNRGNRVAKFIVLVDDVPVQHVRLLDPGRDMSVLGHSNFFQTEIARFKFVDIVSPTFSPLQVISLVQHELTSFDLRAV